MYNKIGLGRCSFQITNEAYLKKQKLKTVVL